MEEKTEQGQMDSTKTLPPKPGDARSSPREEARFDRSLGNPEVGLIHLMPFLLPTKICDSENEAIVALARELVPPGSLLCVCERERESE